MTDAAQRTASETKPLYSQGATLDELQIAVDKTATGISWLDADGRFQQVRPGYAAMLGYRPEELIGQSWAVTVPPADHDIAAAAFQQMLDEGRGTADTRAIRKDGSIFYKRIMLVKTTDGAGRHSGHYCFMNDISERVEAAHRAAESGRLKMLGTLAGGIAHDLNNMLMPIVGYAELIAQDPAHAREAAGVIREASRRAQELIAQLLLFGRDDGGQPEPTRLGQAVSVATKFVAGSLPPRVALNVRDLSSHDQVLGRQVQIELLLVNLVTNAGYAMREQGGTVRLTLDNPSPDTVRLTVADSGEGMTPEVQARIFEPFFTTKSADQGTGLGLMMVRECVEQLRGSIEVRSTPGVGTTFEIVLPLHRAGPGSVEPAPAPTALRRLKVLVVDDDEGVRSVTELMLRQLGHEVRALADLDAAAQCFDDGFDLIITDYRTQGRSGLDFLRENVRADFPAVLMSGQVDDQTELPANVRAVLHKPFDMRRLRQALEGVLGG